jgi:hypothetical protein
MGHICTRSTRLYCLYQSLYIVLIQFNWNIIHIQQIHFLFTYFYFFLAVLRFELRALCLHSITWTMPPVIFALVIFQMRSWFLPRLAWTMILLFMPPTYWDDRYACYCTQLLVEMGSELASNQDPLISTSQVARITSANHCVWPPLPLP